MTSVGNTLAGQESLRRRQHQSIASVDRPITDIMSTTWV
jgi:hypothetical protein